ncbi:MAG TPA: choice-of-anchor D domain-containing protein [Kofleriaceae bacterium]
MGLAVLCSTVGVAAAGKTIFVPADRPTIQGAIDAAVDGDIVEVADGTYAEHVSIAGKAITVRSAHGAATTIIDGGGTDCVVQMSNNDAAALIGFTIRHGRPGPTCDGGGVRIYGGGTVANNVITDNAGCQGIGLYISGSPVVRNNTITNNLQTTCSGGVGGGGIAVVGSSTAKLLDNMITHNTSDADGGAISLFAAGAVTVRGNTISDNTGNQGGAIAMLNDSPALITDNLMVNNHARQSGGGIYVLVPSGSTGLKIVNNTLANNTVQADGSQLYIDGFKSQTQIWNNLFVDASSKVAVTCTTSYDVRSPVMSNNDTYNPTGTTYACACATTTGSNGNVSQDPKFVTAGSNYRLQALSPVRDAGSNTAPGLPATDLAGDPRIVDSDGDGVATVDLGAYEASGVRELSISPPALAFGAQLVGTTSAGQSVTVTNTGLGQVAIASLAGTGDFAQSSTCGATLDVGQACTLTVRFAPTASGARTGSVSITNSTPKQTHVLALTGAATDFALEAAPGGSTSATFDHGASYQLLVAAQGDLRAAVALTCEGAPSGTTCAISPATAMVDGAAAPFTVSIVPAASAAAGVTAPPSGPLLATLLALGVVLAWRAARLPRRRLAAACSALLGVGLAFAACGDGHHGGGPGVDGGLGAGLDAGVDAGSGVPSGTYALTVTGTTGGVSRTLALTLTVP